VTCTADTFGVCDCGCAVGGFTSGVGAFTRVGEYADRVNTMVNTLDVDIQAAIDKGGLGPQFNFNDWIDFVDNPDGIDGLAWHAEPPPPFGWRPFRRDVGSGVIAEGPFHDEDAALRHIGFFEVEYARLRNTFLAAGGKTIAPAPTHPGVFKTPEEEQADDNASARFWTIGLVIAGITAAGYLLSSAAPLFPRRSP
jgi:hypothetical protein